MPFTFKQFHIDDTGCGMPVSTDGVLLGAWAPLTNANRVLDIGAGSGLLSLMAAQRSQADVQAVEIDLDAATACARNFAASPWANRLSLVQSDIQQFCQQYQDIESVLKFDHIICNPPYFDNGPISNTSTRAMARHTQSLGFEQLAVCFKTLLSDNGQVSLILPNTAIDALVQQLQQQHLQISRRVDVASVTHKAPHRVLLTAEHQGFESGSQTSTIPVPITSKLCIRDEHNQYTDHMIALTKDFYLAL